MTSSFPSPSSETSDATQKQIEAWQVFQDVARAYEQSLKEQRVLLEAYLQDLDSQRFSIFRRNPAAGLAALQDRARQDRAYQQAIFWSLQTLCRHNAFAKSQAESFDTQSVHHFGSQCPHIAR